MNETRYTSAASSRLAILRASIGQRGAATVSGQYARM